MIKLPAIVPFLPVIAAGIGAGATIYSGRQAERRNQQYLNRADQAAAAQQQLIGQLMSGITPDAYRAQAEQAGSAALDQISANFAQRGMLSSGAMHTAGAQTLSKLYTDANAAYRQERQNAIGMALGGQVNLNNQWGQRINPDPYGGLGASLGALGQAGAAYLHQNPLPAGTGVGMPGFGVSYPTGVATPTLPFGTTYRP